ncbi:citrate/2-methylcitrate synthase [Olsenella uli]|uniref:citrate/2-methylcitrate synthase n=1 Tax=Olsenella uli TaxID=133926 RepID=UPI00241C8E18|nr:citrate/2-methylcitrate synthase [Olsenella uli]
METSALSHVADAYPMPSVGLGRPEVSDQLYEGMQRVDRVPDELYDRYDVKRGLRNADGSGVLVGLTTISDVHGYNKVDGRIEPDRGDLKYRGYSIADLVAGTHGEDRFGYEEVSYLLLSGKLPTVAQLADFEARIGSRRQLPEGYLDIFPRTTYAHSIMNVLQRATLLLYAFDRDPDDASPEHEIDVALSLLGRWPRVASVAHQAYVAATDGVRLRVPPAREGYTMAETVLDVLRGDEGFSREEAMMLDVMLMLHAEHGGGNNSSFTCRVLSSSGTDAYSAYAAAIGSLKGPRHGGANYKAGEMIDDVAEHVRDWSSDTEVADYLTQILNRQAFDRTGLIYGLGHAVYTVTDPRAEVVRHYARALAERKGQLDKLELIGRVERLGPQLMRDVRGITKPISTNIDLYTGFVYAMLGIPRDLYTPIFALARMSGWAAHRMEELYGPARIIRPAYNSYMTDQSYVPLAERA